MNSYENNNNKINSIMETKETETAEATSAANKDKEHGLATTSMTIYTTTTATMLARDANETTSLDNIRRLGEKLIREHPLPPAAANKIGRKSIIIAGLDQSRKSLAGGLESKSGGSKMRDASRMTLSDVDIGNDIMMGLGELSIDNIFPRLPWNLSFLRCRANLLVAARCAQAAYFVGIANQITSKIEVKKGKVTLSDNKSLMSLNSSGPNTLKMGIVGGGRLGQLLANNLIEYANVSPTDLHLSTKHYETLTQLRNRGVHCYFDNTRLATSAQIIFLCVSTHGQLRSAIDEMRPHLPDKCIMYELVDNDDDVDNTSVHVLKKRLGGGALKCSGFIYKPVYKFKANQDHIDYMKEIAYNCAPDECLASLEMIGNIDPFNDVDEASAIFELDNRSNACFAYALMNICSFLGLNEKQTLSVLETHLLGGLVKLEETHFQARTRAAQGKPKFFQLADLVEYGEPAAGAKISHFENKLNNDPGLRRALSVNFLKYFRDMGT